MPEEKKMNEIRKKNLPRIPARSISLLVTIKQNLMDDNDLCMKVTNCGKYAAAGYIDELIINALAIERLFHSITDQHIAVKKENEEYNDLLYGYTADILDDEQKAEVRALVEKWNAKCDEADDAGGVVSREQQQIQTRRQSDRQAE